MFQDKWRNLLEACGVLSNSKIIKRMQKKTYKVTLDKALKQRIRDINKRFKKNKKTLRITPRSGKQPTV
jgi:hypothetical protein